MALMRMNGEGTVLDIQIMTVVDQGRREDIVFEKTPTLGDSPTYGAFGRPWTSPYFFRPRSNQTQHWATCTGT